MATSDVLSVISRSTTDVQPVFDAIVKSAAKLFDPCIVNICSLEDAQLVFRATASVRYEVKIETAKSLFPTPFDPKRSSSSRAILEQRIIEISDAAAPDVPEFTRETQRALGNFRSITLVPLIREGKGIGVISLAHPEPGFKLSDKQLALVQTFADQAMIAIENTRLFEEVQARTKELQDSLDRQTATSEVLGVISSSPNEVQPVLDTIVATARRLCQAERAIIWRLEGETFRAVARRGQPEEQVESVYSARMTLSRGSMVGRATLARRAVQVEDVATDAELVETHAFNRARNTRNIHTVLAVPLLLKGQPIGGISLSRTRVAPFDDKQVALVEAFADQAVIAIENTRLFEAEQASKRELQESLEYQTATSEVLNVISRSPTSAQPVFDAIVESAARLCDAVFSVVWLYDGELLHCAASHNFTPEVLNHVRKSYPKRPDRSLAAGRVILDGRISHVPDTLADPAYARDLALAGNWRA